MGDLKSTLRVRNFKRFPASTLKVARSSAALCNKHWMASWKSSTSSLHCWFVPTQLTMFPADLMNVFVRELVLDVRAVSTMRALTRLLIVNELYSYVTLGVASIHPLIKRLTKGCNKVSRWGQYDGRTWSNRSPLWVQKNKNRRVQLDRMACQSAR